MKKPRTRRAILLPAVAGMALLAFGTSCAIMPLTHKWQKWAANSLGRSTFLQRLGSGVVMILTSPVLVVTVLVDIPVSLWELLSGEQLINDPLIRAALLEGKPATFFASNGDRIELTPESEPNATALDGSSPAGARIRIEVTSPDGETRRFQALRRADGTLAIL